MKCLTKNWSVAAGMVLALGFVFSAPTASLAVDFSGKTVELIVPFKEGGGGDRYGRLWQPFLEKHLPGKPTVLVVNKPGGGSIKGNNWFEREAKTDGTMAIVGSTSTFTSYVFGGKKVKYNMLNWRAVISSPLGTQFFARADTGIKGKDIVADIKTLRKGNWVASGKTPTSSEMRQFLTYHVLGIRNVKPLFGLSSGRRRKATIRGELQLSYDSTGSFVKKAQKYVKKGVIVHYMTFGFVDTEGNVVRDPAFPNKPTAFEIYEKLNGKKLSGPQGKALLHLLNMGVMASKSLLLAKGTPDDVLKTYTDTVQKILKDKAFMKVARKEIGSYPQYIGKQADRVIKDSVDIEPATKKWLNKWLKEKFDVSL